MKIVVFGATGGTGSQVVERRARGRTRRGRGRRRDHLDDRPADNKKPGTLISTGVENMVRAATKSGVKRFVLESGLMVSDGRALSFIGRIGLSMYRRMNRALYDDKVIAEATVRASDLDWVILRPPMLVHAPAKGGYKHGENARIDPMKSLSHADAAEILLRAAIEPELVRTTQEVGY